jgi:hypothetical protein
MAKEKTIKLNNGFRPDEIDMQDFTLAEYAKRWQTYSEQLYKLCCCDSREAYENNRKTINQIEELIDQMIEVAFNDTYEEQQKKKEAS